MDYTFGLSEIQNYVFECKDKKLYYGPTLNRFGCKKVNLRRHRNNAVQYILGCIELSTIAVLHITQNFELLIRNSKLFHLTELLVLWDVV